jgi:hypothetical protein
MAEPWKPKRSEAVNLRGLGAKSPQAKADMTSAKHGSRLP